MDIKEQILVALGLNKAEEEIKLAWQAKSEDGTIFVSTAEELEAGVDISVLQKMVRLSFYQSELIKLILVYLLELKKKV
jgi:hypothetical protein